MQNGFKAFKTVAAIVTWASVLVIWVLAVLTAAPRIAGMEPYIVLSSSMEPAIPAGAVAYICPVSTGTAIGDGDVIAFYSSGGETKVLHRVAGYDPETGEYTTKGDANDNEDGTKVLRKDIFGVYAAHIPIAGYVLSSLSSHVFYIGSFEIPAFILILVGLITLLNVSKCLIGMVPGGRRETLRPLQDTYLDDWEKKRRKNHVKKDEKTQ